MTSADRDLVITFLLDPSSLQAGEVDAARKLISQDSPELRELEPVIVTLRGVGTTGPPANVADSLRALADRWEATPMMVRAAVASEADAYVHVSAGVPRRGRRGRRRRLVAGATVAGVLISGGYLFFQPRAVVAGKRLGDFPLTVVEANRTLRNRDVEVSLTTRDIKVPLSLPSDYAAGPLAIEEQIYKFKPIVPKLRYKDRNGAIIERDPPDGFTQYDEDPSFDAFELTEQGFEIRKIARNYQAQSNKQVLSTTQDAWAFPGVILNGRRWVVDKSITPVTLDPRSRTPLKLTLYGVSKASDLPSATDLPRATDLSAAGSKNLAAGIRPLDKVAQAEAFTLEEPGNREVYERALRALVPRVTEVSNWGGSVETIHSFDQLNFMVKGSANLTWGPVGGAVAASIRSTEDVEKASVCMLLTRAAYTVAVAEAPPPAAWFSPSADPTRVNFDSPPVYVSSVTYGQVILVVANSAGKSSDLKEALKASFSYAGLASASGEAARAAKTQLDAASLNVFVFGGPANTAVVAEVKPRDQDLGSSLAKLLQAPLKATEALPIAFETRYLADHSPAGFLGVLPMRTYSARQEPFKYSVEWISADLNDDFDGTFRGDGDMWLMTSHGDDAHPLKLGEIVLSEGKYNFNPPKIFGGDTASSLVPSRKFALKVRMGDCDGDKPGDWNAMTSLDSMGEDSVEVDLQDLLRQPGYYKDYRVGVNKFPSGNSITLRVRLAPPSVTTQATSENTALRRSEQ